MFKVVEHKDEEGRPTGLFVVVNAQEKVVSKPLPIAEAKRLADQENAREQQAEEVEKRRGRDSGPSMGM
jgi:hypothetical protein